MKKFHARRVALKNIPALAQKNWHTRKILSEKNLVENPPTTPLITLLMVRP